MPRCLELEIVASDGGRKTTTTGSRRNEIWGRTQNGSGPPRVASSSRPLKTPAQLICHHGFKPGKQDSREVPPEGPISINEAHVGNPNPTALVSRTSCAFRRSFNALQDQYDIEVTWDFRGCRAQLFHPFPERTRGVVDLDVTKNRNKTLCVISSQYSSSPSLKQSTSTAPLTLPQSSSNRAGAFARTVSYTDARHF